MEKTPKLKSRLIDLCDNANLKSCSVFVLSDGNTEEDAIKEYAFKLLERGAREIFLCGEDAEKWHSIFDLVWVEIYAETEEVCLTYSVDSVISIPEEFCMCNGDIIIFAVSEELLIECARIIEEHFLIDNT